MQHKFDAAYLTQTRKADTPLPACLHFGRIYWEHGTSSPYRMESLQHNTV